MSKPNGWQLRSGRAHQFQPVMPADISKWDRLLYGLGVEESALRKDLRTAAGETARQFAVKYHDKSYVPEWLLMELGLRSRFEG